MLPSKQTTINSIVTAALFGAYAFFLTVGIPAQAQELKGPTQFNLAILDQDPVSFVVPSTVIVDERGKVSGVIFNVTNHTRKDQEFAIDQVRVKEIVKPGETKTIKLSATDLDAIGTDQSVFPYFLNWSER